MVTASPTSAGNKVDISASSLTTLANLLKAEKGKPGGANNRLLRHTLPAGLQLVQGALEQVCGVGELDWCVCCSARRGAAGVKRLTAGNSTAQAHPIHTMWFVLPLPLLTFCHPTCCLAEPRLSSRQERFEPRGLHPDRTQR